VVIVASLVVLSAAAQEQDLKASTQSTKSPAPLNADRLVSAFSAEANASTTNRSQKKGLRLGGPVGNVIKTRKLNDIPRQILSSVNPFSSQERVPRTFERRSDLNPRAWTTTVGLHPGESAFSDARTHEPNLTLLTLGK
jgi:hypothetical protein